jgi:hypothetical protein
MAPKQAPVIPLEPMACLSWSRLITLLLRKATLPEPAGMWGGRPVRGEEKGSLPCLSPTRLTSHNGLLDEAMSDM